MLAERMLWLRSLAGLPDLDATATTATMMLSVLLVRLRSTPRLPNGGAATRGGGAGDGQVRGTLLVPFREGCPREATAAPII